MPLITGESAPTANLWRENVANRQRMGRELRERGIKDVPWSSSKRFMGVVLTCVTFGLWVVAGFTSLLLFVFGGNTTRCCVVAYYCLALLYAPTMSMHVYRWAAVGAAHKLNAVYPSREKHLVLSTLGNYPFEIE